MDEDYIEVEPDGILGVFWRLLSPVHVQVASQLLARAGGHCPSSVGGTFLPPLVPAPGGTPLWAARAPRPPGLGAALRPWPVALRALPRLFRGPWLCHTGGRSAAATHFLRDRRHLGAARISGVQPLFALKCLTGHSGLVSKAKFLMIPAFPLPPYSRSSAPTALPSFPSSLPRSLSFTSPWPAAAVQASGISAFNFCRFPFAIFLLLCSSALSHVSSPSLLRTPILNEASPRLSVPH